MQARSLQLFCNCLCMLQFVDVLDVPLSFDFSRVDFALRVSPLPDFAALAGAVFLRGLDFDF